MIKYFLDSMFGVNNNGAFSYDMIRKGTVVSETSIAYNIESKSGKHVVAKSITANTYAEAEALLTSQYSNWGDEPYDREKELKESKKSDWREVE